ncbi:FecR domain-containing protein [Pseudanabaena sp. UWO311]|uniref:FecR domain-containing protein n=1 Tax=Pseudanabaena sp. UWO311 TaxID=2487337 RepID=UPI0011597BF4|nr:FecR domain-containing protein [Pseudanabaena sp. UWO311]TYQ29186.1 FecR domain-containing protein [Pseudanabaena sp. UWO311]
MKKILLLIFISLIASCSNSEPSPNSSQTPANITTANPTVSTTTTTSTTQPNADIQSAKVAEILDGDQVFIHDRKAAVNDIAKSQERIRTGESGTEIEFNNHAIARLSHNSLLTVGGCGAQLLKGSVLINGAVSACTSSINTGVRGTTYLLEIDEDGNDQIQVLEGEVAVTRNDEPTPQIQVVKSGERLRNFRKTKKVVLQKISQSEYETLLISPLVKGYKRDLPSLGKVKAKFQVLFPNVKPPVLERKNDLKIEKLERPEIREKPDQKGKSDFNEDDKKSEPKDQDKKDTDKEERREPIKDNLRKSPSRQ